MQNQAHILTPKFKIGEVVRLSKQKNLFCKRLCYGPKKFLWLKKVKNTVPQTYVISDLNYKEIVGMFHEKELQKN